MEPLNYSSQLTLEEFGQTWTDISLTKVVFQVFPTEINSKILRKATFFSLKHQVLRKKPHPCPLNFIFFFYTENNTRIENLCYNGRTFSQLS